MPPSPEAFIAPVDVPKQFTLLDKTPSVNEKVGSVIACTIVFWQPKASVTTHVYVPGHKLTAD